MSPTNPLPEAPDLDAIQKRCDAATEGPWQRDEFGNSYAVFTDRGDEDDDEARLCYFYADFSGIPKEDAGANADLCAHARADLPAIICYARTLEARVRELEADRERLERLEDAWIENEECPIILTDDGFLPSLSGVWKKNQTLREAIDNYGQGVPPDAPAAESEGE